MLSPQGSTAAPLTWDAVPHPVIYEINTWPWLASVSAQEGRSIDLGSVPAAYWDEIVFK